VSRLPRSVGSRQPLLPSAAVTAAVEAFTVGEGDFTAEAGSTVGEGDFTAEAGSTVGAQAVFVVGVSTVEVSMVVVSAAAWAFVAPAFVAPAFVALVFAADAISVAFAAVDSVVGVVGATGVTDGDGVGDLALTLAGHIGGDTLMTTATALGGMTRTLTAIPIIAPLAIHVLTTVLPTGTTIRPQIRRPTRRQGQGQRPTRTALRDRGDLPFREAMATRAIRRATLPRLSRVLVFSRLTG